MKSRSWLFLFFGALAIALVAWRFHDVAYAYAWRLVHDDKIAVGQKEFRVPDGLYIWTDQPSKRGSIFSLSGDKVVITIHDSGDDSELTRRVELELCAHVKCEVHHDAINLGGSKVSSTMIRHWMIVDRPMVKAFYSPAGSKFIIEFDGDEDGLRHHQPTISALLEQAAR